MNQPTRAELLGVSPGMSNLNIAQKADVVVLAVKPQKMTMALASSEN